MQVIRIEAVDYTVIHPASSDQAVVDTAGKGLRKGRASLASAIPIPTTASKGVERLFLT